MDKTFKYFAISLLIIAGLLLGACGQAAPDTIKVGVNAPSDW
jgi:hypothetical protein